MNDLMNDMEQAEQFLNGKLNDVDKNNFANRLDNDEDFSRLTQDMAQMIEGIKSSGQKSTIEEKIELLKTFSQKELEEGREEKIVTFKKEPRSLYSMKYAIAAGVAFLALTIFAIINRESFLSKPDLYAAYFETFDSPGSGLTRSHDSNVSLKSEAYEAYDAGNYTAASELFEKVLLEKDDAIVHLCLANSYMAINEFDKAEATLRHMLKVHSDLITQAKWYLALIYVKQSRMERAKAILWEISDSSTYGEKAKKLLDELD
jgi:tetratricopeptide (TPR) repeat protein